MEFAAFVFNKLKRVPFKNVGWEKALFWFGWSLTIRFFSEGNGARTIPETYTQMSLSLIRHTRAHDWLHYRQDSFEGDRHRQKTV